MGETRLGAAESQAGSSLALGAASCLRIQKYIGKGQLVSSGDAELGIWKCRRFPGVLLALAFPRNKIGLIIALSQSSSSGALNNA